MALDLQTVHPQNTIPVSSTSLIMFGGLRALDVLGEDFRSVDAVFINDIKSPDIIVVSPTRLIAQLPDSLQETPDVQSITVVSRTLTLTASSLLKFVVGDTPGSVSGILRLLQLFVKILLSEPGSDVFNKDMGGALLRNVGATFGSEEGEGIRADATVAVDRTARQVLSLQSRDGTVPRDERLLSANLVGATFSRASSSLFLSIEVVSQIGASARLNMEL